MLRRALPLALVTAVIALAGCGSDSGTTTTPTGAGSPESGTQSVGGFPGAGATTGPNVITTQGPQGSKSKGKAGAGSGATCIGC